MPQQSAEPSLRRVQLRVVKNRRLFYPSRPMGTTLMPSPIRLERYFCTTKVHLYQGINLGASQGLRHWSMTGLYTVVSFPLHPN